MSKRLGNIAKVSPALQILLEQAKSIVITPAMLWDQRVSWAYGQLILADSLVRYDEVVAEATRIYGPRPEEKQ